MTGAIIRDAHPAAPRTPETAPSYDVVLWIDEQLPAVQDVETRLYLIAERGRLTQQIWLKSRDRRAT